MCRKFSFCRSVQNCIYYTCCLHAVSMYRASGRYSKLWGLEIASQYDCMGVQFSIQKAVLPSFRSGVVHKGNSEWEKTTIHVYIYNKINTFSDIMYVLNIRSPTTHFSFPFWRVSFKIFKQKSGIRTRRTKKRCRIVRCLKQIFTSKFPYCFYRDKCFARTLLGTSFYTPQICGSKLLAT